MHQYVHSIDSNRLHSTGNDDTKQIILLCMYSPQAVINRTESCTGLYQQDVNLSIEVASREYHLHAGKV